jgi:hypothetical protein
MKGVEETKVELDELSQWFRFTKTSATTLDTLNQRQVSYSKRFILSSISTETSKQAQDGQLN